MGSLEAMDIDSAVCPSPHSLSANRKQLCSCASSLLEESWSHLLHETETHGGGHGFILKTCVGSCPRNGETPLCPTP